MMKADASKITETILSSFTRHPAAVQGMMS